MPNIFIFLEADTLINNIYINNKLYEDLSKNFNINFVNISNIVTYKSKKKLFPNVKKKIRSKYNLINIKDLNNFNKFFSDKKKSLIIPNFSRTFKFFYLFYLIKKFSFIPFIIQNIGYISGNINFSKGNNFKKFNFSKIINYIIKIKISYFFYRLFIFLNIFSQIEYRFISNREWYNTNNKSFYFKLQKKIRYLKILEYKKTILVNSRTHDFFFDFKKKIRNKYIVYVDSPLYHHDNIQVDGIIEESLSNRFYHYVNLFLNDLQKKFKKRVIICANPKYNLSIIKKKFPNFNVVKYKTNEFVSQSFITLFLDSSAILDAIYLKKNIINLNSYLIGKNYFHRNNVYHRRINLFKKIIEQEKKINKIEFLKVLNNKKKNYTKFIKNFLVESPKIKGSYKITNILLKTLRS
jgi:hypothetical protein